MAKDHDIYIRVEKDIKEKLKEICKKEHRTQSDQISYWIENYKLNTEESKEG